MVYSITHKSLIHITRSFCAAIVRMVFNVQMVNAGLAKKTDVNMGLTTLMYWSMVEAGLSLIAANLPSICSFFSQSASLPLTFSSLRSKFTLRSFRSTDKLRGSSKDKAYEHEVASSSNGSSHKHPLKEGPYYPPWTYHSGQYAVLKPPTALPPLPPRRIHGLRAAYFRS